MQRSPSCAFLTSSSLQSSWMPSTSYASIIAPGWRVLGLGLSPKLCGLKAAPNVVINIIASQVVGMSTNCYKPSDWKAHIFKLYTWNVISWFQHVSTFLDKNNKFGLNLHISNPFKYDENTNKNTSHFHLGHPVSAGWVKVKVRDGWSPS